MMRAASAYLARLSDEFGHGWNRFWFTPSDPAALAAMRLSTGLILVYLHATLSFDLVAFFGPEGLLPASEIAPLEGQTLSYLNYLSAPAELWAVHAIGLAILMAFAAGLFTRVTSVLSLVVLVSNVNRAPMLTSLTEALAAMVVLYLCLAPCGKRYSLDAWFARRGPHNPPAVTPSTMATIATRLIQIHLALLVAMMGFSKLGSDVWWVGTGVWWLMARPESRLVDVTSLHRTPLLIDAWTHLIVLFELAFPVLIWVPLARPLLLAAGAIVWTSIALLTGEATFALMMLVASLAFVSPELIVSCCRKPAAA